MFYNKFSIIYNIYDTNIWIAARGLWINSIIVNMNIFCFYYFLLYILKIIIFNIIYGLWVNAI